MEILLKAIERLLNECDASHSATIKHSFTETEETVELCPFRQDACCVLVWRDHATGTNVVEIGTFSVELYGDVDAVRDIVLAVVQGQVSHETRLNSGRPVAVRVTWPRQDGTTYMWVNNISFRRWGQAQTTERRCGPYAPAGLRKSGDAAHLTGLATPFKEQS